jgi:beta-glucanase (GH16 family)
MLLRSRSYAQARGTTRLDRGALELTFSEEFSTLNASPDGSRGWRTTFANGERTLPNNHEAQHYVDAEPGSDILSVEDGNLRITARPRSGPGGLTYASGLLTSERLFSQLYGHFEMRAKLPAGPGFWPAFWLLPTDRSWPPELDVVELLGRNPTQIWVSTHSRAGGRHHANNIRVSVRDVSARFHLFGASWRPEGIRWFLDDLEIARAPVPADMHKPMYLLMNLAVGGVGSWPGPADGTSSATMLVDFVRGYRFMSPDDPPASP